MDPLITIPGSLMSIDPTCRRCLTPMAGIVCAVMLWLGCPASAIASCGDYLQGHLMHVVPSPKQELPPIHAPLPPCRCHGVECQTTPLSPLPTGLPIPRGILQSALWMTTHSSLTLQKGFSARVADEVFDLLTVHAVEHVPIAATVTPV
ncbi:MAG TPA: hypothetical protein VFG20_17030 [Planctomycetaceae bacterium]|nr:hypothetical protein [Planctomycetaceae bacterium]